MSESTPSPDPKPASEFPQPRLPLRKAGALVQDASDTAKLQKKKKTVRISLPPEPVGNLGIHLRRKTTRARRTWWKFWKR